MARQGEETLLSRYSRHLLCKCDWGDSWKLLSVAPDGMVSWARMVEEAGLPSGFRSYVSLSHHHHGSPIIGEHSSGLGAINIMDG